MNSRRLPFNFVIAALVLLCVGGGVALWSQRGGQAEAPPLAGSGLGGPFSLIDQNGRAVTDKSFAGQYMLVYFGYTFCPDVCPLDTQKLATALRTFEKADPVRAAKVQPMFITVDPERDTPIVLKQFVSAFHPRLIGLTGTVAQVDAAKKAYKVYAQKAESPGGGPAPAKDYLVDHTAIIYLMGPDGKPITFDDHNATAAQIAADLERYVR
jgi:protein SCO1